MCARGLVAEPVRELERPFAPDDRALGSTRRGSRAARARCTPGELDRLAERLQDLDRLQRLAAGGVAVAHVPVQPGQDQRAAAERRPVVERGPLRDRALDRRKGVLEPVDGVAAVASSSSTAACRLRDAGRGGSTRAGSGSTPPGSSRAAAARRAASARIRDDVLRARGLGMVDDVGRIRVGSQEHLEDLGVEPPTRGDREARPNRVSCQLVPEPHVARRRREQLPAAPAPPPRAAHAGITASSTQVLESVRHDGDELDQAARVVVEPRRTSEDGVVTVAAGRPAREASSSVTKKGLPRVSAKGLLRVATGERDTAPQTGVRAP